MRGASAELELLLGECLLRLGRGEAAGVPERLAEALMLAVAYQARGLPEAGQAIRVQAMYRDRPEVWILARRPGTQDLPPLGPLRPQLGPEILPNGWPP